MVRIQVTYDDGTTQFDFLPDFQTYSKIQDIIGSITEIANLQQQIHLLSLRLLPRLSSLLRTHPQALVLHRTLSEATSYASKDQVLHGKPLSNLVLRGHFRSLEKEFARVSKELGFPESNLGQFLSGLELFQEDKVQLWWAGKELKKEKALFDYTGKNEKTKIMILLQSLPTNSSTNLTIAGDAPA